MNKKRILVCGGRDFAHLELFNHTMSQCEPYFSNQFCVISGDAKGADRMAIAWAAERGVPIIKMPANWQYYGNNAGPVRNMWMLDWGLPDLIIAFPGGSGTRNMCDQARARGIDVYPVKYLHLPELKK